MGPLICMQLCKGGRADVGSQLDMYTCSDLCTYSNQGVGTRRGLTETFMQDFIGAHMFAWIGSQSDMYTCTDASTWKKKGALFVIDYIKQSPVYKSVTIQLFKLYEMKI